MTGTPRGPVSVCVERALERYFRDLDGAAACDVYDLVIRESAIAPSLARGPRLDPIGEVERPLLETVLGYTRGNQVRAAAILGINRNTLRARIKHYRLTV